MQANCPSPTDDGLEILAKRFIKLTYRAVGEGLAPPTPIVNDLAVGEGLAPPHCRLLYL